MIKAMFILKNYVQPKLLQLNRKGGNATYFYRDGKQYTIVRESNYVYGKFPDNTIKMYIEHGGVGFNIDEALYENGIFTKLLTTCNHSQANDVGYEDPRCVNWDNTQYVMFNRRNLTSFDLVQMHIGEINNNFMYVNDKVLPNLMKIEKNWQPINNMPGMCVYSYKPYTLVNVFTGQFKNMNTATDIDFRGSSQIVKYKENNLGIVHIRNEAFEYLSYFILFDKDMNILKISDPFSFFGANIEFVTHAEYDNKLKVLVSVHDQILYEFSLCDDSIEQILRKEFNKSTISNEIFTNLYNDAIANNNVFGALGIATFSKDIRIIYDAIQRNYNNEYVMSNYRQILQRVLIGNTK